MSGRDCPVIYRASLVIDYMQTVRIHRAGRLLSAAPSRQGLPRIDLWYTTYQEGPGGAPPEQFHERRVYIAGTGHDQPPGFHVATVVMPDGFVWHIFDGDGTP